MLIHQLLHGYKRGHQLLAGSIRLDSPSNELITRLSDLSGSMTFDLEVRPYLTCYPLPNLKFYAIAQTWLDTSATRAGCVLTHTILVSVDDWMKSRNPWLFSQLFRKPDNSSDTEEYIGTLETNHDNLELDYSRLSPQTKEIDLTTEFVYRFFGEGANPVIWFTENDAQDYFWRLVQFLWPQLRAQFACCTFSLQPRYLDNRPFDLMFAPQSAYSRFQQLPRDSILDPNDLHFSRGSAALQSETWIREWVFRIIHEPFQLHNRENRGSIDEELREFGQFLNSDPTAIRRLYLLHELREQSSDSPLAIIGLLDMVESLAPRQYDAINYKEMAITLVLQAISKSKNVPDALKGLMLLGERLKHDAFDKVPSKLISEYYALIKSFLYKEPSLTLQAGERLLDLPGQVNDSPYVKGVIKGYLELGEEYPSLLNVLIQHPSWASSLIVAEPQLAIMFLYSQPESSPNINLDILVSWLAEVSDGKSLDRVRRVLLSNITDDGQRKLAIELLRQLRDEDVAWVLDSLLESTEGFKPNKIREVICACVSKPHANHTRLWALNCKSWTIEIADIVSATYPQNLNGITELTSTSIYNEVNKAQIVALFIQDVSPGGVLPQWLNDFAGNDENLLKALLLFDEGLAPEVEVVSKWILDQVWNLPLIHHFEVNEIDKLISSNKDLAASLMDASMRNALTSFIDGQIDLASYLSCESTQWGKNWIIRVDSDHLYAIIKRSSFVSTGAWTNVWQWLAKISNLFYSENPMPLPRIIETLLLDHPLRWPIEATVYWVEILGRINSGSKKTIAMQCNIVALDFAFRNTRLPLSPLVVETFLPVYDAVVGSQELPNEIYKLFGYFDWDKGKELRKKLIDSFINSDWPPGDLALAAKEKNLLRKIYSRLKRNWAGDKYIRSMANDLKTRSQDNVAVAVVLRDFHNVMSQNNREAWD